MAQYHGPVEETELTIAQKLYRAKTAPAFPVNVYEGHVKDGMTLRDYLAAKALTGLLAEANSDYQDDAIAELAYSLADAMLKARDK